jgi:hypothetical protein
LKEQIELLELEKEDLEIEIDILKEESMVENRDDVSEELKLENEKLKIAI